MNVINLPLNVPLIEQRPQIFEGLAARHDVFLRYSKDCLEAKAYTACGQWANKAHDQLLEMERRGYFFLAQGEDPNIRRRT